MLELWVRLRVRIRVMVRVRDAQGTKCLDTKKLGYEMSGSRGLNSMQQVRHGIRSTKFLLYVLVHSIFGSCF